MKKLKILLPLSLIFIYVFYITSNLIYKTHYKDGYIEVEGYITSINAGEKTTLIIKAKEKITVTYYGIVNYELGDYIKVTGLLETPNENTIFNLYNYRLYLMSNKIYHTLKAEKLEKLKNNKNILFKIKNYIYKRIDGLDSKDYLKTFILGDKSDLDTSIKTIYQENGISHLLAISGMHITLLASILNLLFKRFKKSHLIISLFLITYAFLLNFTPSVIRAVVFFAFKTDKKKLILILCSIMLIYNPYYIYDVGFLFSFIISFYLIMFGNLSNKFNNYFIKLLITSTICFLASIPILINNFYSINIMSPIINLIFIPFISFIIFPFSLITLIIPSFDSILYLTIKILEYMSIFFNKFNLNIIFCKIPIIFFLFYYVIITIILIKPKYFYILIIVLFFHTNIINLNYNNTLTFLDVGQGDSSLFKIKNTTILIDTGGIYSYSMSDKKLIPYFKSLGIKKVNYLVLTHGDYDHMGEAINLVNNFKVEKVIFNCGEFNELEQELIKVLDNKKIPYYSCIRELNIDNSKLYFLNSKNYGNENDNSSVIYTELEKHKFLFMGDAGVEVEEDLMKKYNLQDIDVLKVGHHGSKTSSGKKFIDEINPKYGVISVGKNNRYGHPNDNVLDNLEDSIIYRTDQDGSIMFKINKYKLKIETCTP